MTILLIVLGAELLVWVLWQAQKQREFNEPDLVTRYRKVWRA